MNWKYNHGKNRALNYLKNLLRNYVLRKYVFILLYFHKYFLAQNLFRDNGNWNN